MVCLGPEQSNITVTAASSTEATVNDLCVFDVILQYVGESLNTTTA